MIYTFFTNDQDYLEEDGFGPLDYESAASMADYLKGGLQIGKLNCLSVKLTDKIAPPDILFPQSTKLVLVHEPLMLHKYFQQCFDVKTKVDISFGEFVKARRFLLCEFKFTERNAAEWIDFSISKFSIAKTISLGRKEPPRIIERDMSFSSHLEYSKKSDELSTLRKIVPESLFVKVDEIPSSFQLDGVQFFGGGLFKKLKNGDLVGLTATGTFCRVENDQAISEG